jgi:DNA modification methylase
VKSGTIYVGDCRKVLPTLPADSVDCVVTSPPYWGLRDYGTAEWVGGDPDCAHDVQRWDGPKQTQGAMSGHAAKANRLDRRECRCGAERIDSQIGLEPVPDCGGLECGECYVCHLVAVFREVRRILKPTGVLWLNLGDCWNSNAGDYRGVDSSGLSGSLKREGADLRPQGRPRFKGLKPKDQVGIPWRVALALQADGWYLRKDVIEEVELYCPCGCGHVLEERIWRHAPDRVVVWEKPDPMPESVTDRPTASHEYLFLFSKRPTYAYDGFAIREPDVGKDHPRHVLHRAEPSGGIMPPHNGLRRKEGRQGEGRNKRSVWTIATQPYRGAHFATFPEALVVPCILAGTSARGVCPDCGAPWERITGRPCEECGGMVETQAKSCPGCGHVRNWRVGRQVSEDMRATDWSTPGHGVPRLPGDFTNGTTTLGWRPTCAHEALEPVPATIFDPFLGSGTVAMVATGHGRRWAGIELSAHSAHVLSVDRIGSMFCDVIDLADVEAKA